MGCLNVSENLASFTRIYNDPKFRHIKTSPKKLKNLEKEGLIETKIDTDGLKKVVVPSLEAYVNKEKLLLEKFYTIGQAARTLISHKYKYIGEFKLESYKANIMKMIEDGILISEIFRGIIYISKKSVEDFFSNHISREEALEKFNSGEAPFWKLIKRNNIKDLRISHHHIFYPRKQVEALIAEYNYRVLQDDVNNGTLIKGKQYNPDNLYTATKAREMLGLTKGQWKTLIEVEQMIPIILGGIRFYEKSKIDDLKKLQNKMRNEFYTTDETQQILKLQFNQISHSLLVKNRMKMPTLFRGLVPNTGYRYIYPKKLVEQIAAEYELKETVSTLTDNVEAFEYLLNQLGLHFSSKNRYSIKLWKDFVYRTLGNSTESSETVQYTIFRYANCTQILNEVLEGNEIYEYTSNQLNLKLFNENIPVKYQRIFYAFINSIYKTLMEKTQKKLFKFEMIINPNKFSGVNHRDKSIYEYEEYKKLITFTTNVQIHKINAINDVKYQISNNFSKNNKEKKQNYPKVFDYDSVWLYVLIHINNAWRHSDVVQFPKLDLSKLSAKDISLEWLLHNDIEADDVRRIITQIMQKDLKTEKTNATNRFFCSDKLKLSLATAAVICELRRSALTPNYDYLINFSTKRNELPDRVRKHFFKGFLKKFKFESLKMNRTLLSFMYYLLVKKGNSSAALEVAQRLRAHLDFETTNIYIYIPESELNDLTHQLFMRENFGYISDLFADILYGKTVNRKERTEEILHLKKTFGNPYNIEATAGYLNNILAERKSVSQMILSMGIDEATETMFKLDAQLLPSKEDNIQCLVGVENCIKDKINCKNCQMSVPNFYALSSLAQSLSERVQKLSNIYHDEFDAEKTKLVNLYSVEIDQWKRAIEVFGKDVVYQFVSGGSDFLKSEMQKIPSDFVNKYRTYIPQK